MDILLLDDKKLKEMYFKKTLVDKDTVNFSFNYSVLNDITLPVEVEDTLVKLNEFLKENHLKFKKNLESKGFEFYDNSFHSNIFVELNYSSENLSKFVLEGMIDITFKENYQKLSKHYLPKIFKSLFKYENNTLYLANRNQKDNYLYEGSFSNTNSFCILNCIPKNKDIDIAMNIDLKEESDEYLLQLNSLIEIIEH